MGGVSFVGIIVVIAAAAAIRCWYHTYSNKLDVRATSNILCTPYLFWNWSDSYVLLLRGQYGHNFL